MNDVMLDLETMGTGPRAAIVAIGAVEFDLAAGVIGERFFRAVTLSSSMRMGGEIDADTVLWWMRQSDAAREQFASGGEDISRALLDFAQWLGARAPVDDVRVWGNGAAFDNVVLRSAYQAAYLEPPWRFWNDRCYRTMKADHQDVEVHRVGVHHNARDDAETQARHMLAIRAKLNLTRP